MKTSKKIYLISPRGFCAGVTRAIEIVELAIKKYGPPVYVNHEIVHNKYVIDELSDKGAVFLDNIIKSSRVIDVVNYFINKKNIKNIYFIIGSDNLIRFHKWKSWKKIVKLVKLVVFSRKGYDKKGMKSTVVKNFKNKIIFIKNKPISFSSSQLKKQIKLKI